MSSKGSQSCLQVLRGTVRNLIHRCHNALACMLKIPKTTGCRHAVRVGLPGRCSQRPTSVRCTCKNSQSRSQNPVHRRHLMMSIVATPFLLAPRESLSEAAQTAKLPKGVLLPCTSCHHSGLAHWCCNGRAMQQHYQVLVILLMPFAVVQDMRNLPGNLYQPYRMPLKLI